MPNPKVDNLNHRFAIRDNLIFKEGTNELIYAEIKNEAASAQIYLHGAHITSFTPLGEDPVIFLSSLSQIEPGKAIRGGIPISWPWFADHPTDKTKPAHGFARTSLWEVRETQNISKDKTVITLGLRDNEETQKLWDYSFDLELAISIGKELNSELTMTNSGKEDFTITSAFHSYYIVGDVNDIAIYGLEDTNYIDKVDNFSMKLQDSPVKIADETDRIYLDTTSDCVIEDPSLNRQIRIRKSGSSSTVVWNPWMDGAKKMKDLGDLDYLNFVCVETTNAGEDRIKLAPDKQHKLELNVIVKNP